MPILNLKKYAFLTRESPELLLVSNDMQHVQRAFTREQIKLIMAYEAFLRTDPPRIDAIPMPAGFVEFADLWNLHPNVSVDLCFSCWDEQGNLIPGAGKLTTFSLMGGTSIPGQMYDLGKTDPMFCQFILDETTRRNILTMFASTAETEQKRKRISQEGFVQRTKECAERARIITSKPVALAGPADKKKKMKPTISGGSSLPAKLSFTKTAPAAPVTSTSGAEATNAMTE
ncbi:hypothetical protein BD779DRAFT_1469525 [Infundibulicybe gibba]|nr:hypothetical protein BD779DRAFT_1469525 [Infundibulicybe gibba]